MTCVGNSGGVRIVATVAKVLDRVADMTPVVSTVTCLGHLIVRGVYYAASGIPEVKKCAPFFEYKSVSRSAIGLFPIVNWGLGVADIIMLIRIYKAMQVLENEKKKGLDKNSDSKLRKESVEIIEKAHRSLRRAQTDPNIFIVDPNSSITSPVDKDCAFIHRDLDDYLKTIASPDEIDLWMPDETETWLVEQNIDLPNVDIKKDLKKGILLTALGKFHLENDPTGQQGKAAMRSLQIMGTNLNMGVQSLNQNMGAIGFAQGTTTLATTKDRWENQKENKE